MSKNVKSSQLNEKDVLVGNSNSTDGGKWSEMPWSCKPNPPSSNFAGRQEYLEKIWSAFLGPPSYKNIQNEGCTSLLVISGPPGIGKKEMARKIVSDLPKSNMAENPGFFLWFDLSSHDTLFLCLYDICRHFKLKSRIRLKEMKNGGIKWRLDEKLPRMMQDLYNYFHETNTNYSFIFANVYFPMESYESGDKLKEHEKTRENSRVDSPELSKYFPSKKTSENAQLFIIISKTNLTSLTSDDYLFQNYLAVELEFKFKLCHVDLSPFREKESIEFLKNVLESSSSSLKYNLKVDFSHFESNAVHQMIRRPHIFSLGVPFTLNLLFSFFSYQLKFKKKSNTTLNLEHEILDLFKDLDARQPQQRARSISDHFNPMDILLKLLYETIKEESRNAARFLGKIVFLAAVPLRATFLAQIYAQTAHIPNQGSPIFEDFKKDLRFLETLGVLTSQRINPVQIESKMLEFSRIHDDAIYQKYFELHENFRGFVKKRVLHLPQEDGQTLLSELNKTLKHILKGQDLSLDLITHCKNVHQAVKKYLKRKSDCTVGMLPKEPRLRKIIGDGVATKMSEILEESLKVPQLIDLKAGEFKIKSPRSFSNGSFLYEISAENYTLWVLKMLFKYQEFRMVEGVAMETLEYLTGLRGHHCNHVIFTKERSVRKVTKKAVKFTGEDVWTLVFVCSILMSKFQKYQLTLCSFYVEKLSKMAPQKMSTQSEMNAWTLLPKFIQHQKTRRIMSTYLVEIGLGKLLTKDFFAFQNQQHGDNEDEEIGTFKMDPTVFLSILALCKEITKNGEPQIIQKMLKLEIVPNFLCDSLALPSDLSTDSFFRCIKEYAEFLMIISSSKEKPDAFFDKLLLSQNLAFATSFTLCFKSALLQTKEMEPNEKSFKLFPFLLILIILLTEVKNVSLLQTSFQNFETTVPEFSSLEFILPPKTNETAVYKGFLENRMNLILDLQRHGNGSLSFILATVVVQMQKIVDN